VAVLTGSLIVSSQLHQLHLWPFYFTNLVYIALTIYLASSALYTALYRLSCNRPDKSAPLLPAPILFTLHHVLYVSLVTSHIVVLVVYWSLIYQPDIPQTAVYTWIDFSQHALNAVFIMLEVVLGRMMLRWIDCCVVLLVPVLYAAYTWAIYGLYGQWVYRFLDWNQGRSTPLWYVIMLAMFVGVFVIMRLLHRVREWFGRRLDLFGRVRAERMVKEMEWSEISRELTV